MRRFLTTAILLAAHAAVLAYTLAAPREARAQSYGPGVLQLPASTRALGMADAFPVGGSDSDAVFYNLALSQNIAGVTLAGQRWGASGTMLTVSGAAEWWGGRIALGVLALDYAPSIFIEGNPDGDLDEAELFEGGTARSELVAVLGYTRRIFGIRIAAVGKAITQRWLDDRETTVALDLSSGHVFGPVTAGLSVQNIGTSADFSGQDADAPLRLTVAASWRTLQLGPLDVLPAASITRTPDGTIVPAAGVEVGYWPIQGRTFIARFGVRDPASESADPFTIGAGFAGDRISLDWAWVPFDAGSSHRVSVRWR
jgi:hypothetical protein